MKIGVVINGFDASVGGGYTFQESLISCLPEFARNSAHEFTIFSYGNLDRFKDDSRFSGLTFVEISSQQPSNIGQRVARKLKQQFKKPKDHLTPVTMESKMIEQKISIVWFVSGGWWQPLDIPYIATVWDLMHLSHPWFPEVSGGGEWDSRQNVLGKFIRRASLIITGTDAGRREIETYYSIPKERIHLIPHPTPQFSLDSCKYESNILLDNGISGKYLIYPAQFWPHKNHVALLKVMKLLIDQGIDRFSIVFVGSDKGNLEYVKRYAEDLGVSDWVHFLGFVSTADLIYLYSNAFALTYVSFCGPENLPPLEAFSLKCPVIASDIEGAREQLGNAAVLVDPINPLEIANNILSLERDEAYRKVLIDRGFERSLSWTPQNYMQKVLDLIENFTQIRDSWG